MRRRILGQADSPGNHAISPVNHPLTVFGFQEETIGAVRTAMLMLLGADSGYRIELGDRATPAYFQSLFSDIEVQTLPATGHMLHQDDSAACARAIEEFFSRHAV